MKVFKQIAAFLLAAVLLVATFPVLTVDSAAVGAPSSTSLTSVKYNKANHTTYFVWNKVSNADGYEIWYRVKDSGNDFEKLVSIDQNIERIGVMEKSLPPTQSYEFKILAFAAEGTTFYNSSFSSIYTLYASQTAPSTPAVTTKLDDPKLSVSVGKTEIKLSWNSISEAEKYEITYMSSSASGNSYTLLAEVNSGSTSYKTSELDTSKSYKFRVRAYKTVNGNKIYSDYSNIVTSGTTAAIDDYITITVKKGTTLSLSAGGTASWKSSNSKVAAVSKGTVKAKKAGTAIITASAGSASVKIKVIVK